MGPLASTDARRPARRPGSEASDVAWRRASSTVCAVGPASVDEMLFSTIAELLARSCSELPCLEKASSTIVSSAHFAKLSGPAQFIKLVRAKPAAIRQTLDWARKLTCAHALRTAVINSAHAPFRTP